MFTKLIRFLSITAFFLLPSGIFITAQNIDNHDEHIKIAVFKNAQPVIFVDKLGNPAGIYPDILSKVLTDAGYQVEYIIFSTFQEAFATATAGKVDIMPALVKTREREQIFDFGQSSFFVSWSQVFINEDSRIESVFELKDKKIGMQTAGQNGKNFTEMMDSFGIPFEQVDIATFDEITEAIIDGRIDAGIYFSTYFNEKLEIKPTNIVFSPSNSYVAVPKGTDPELLRIIDEALEEAKEDQESFYYDIMKKYRLIYYNDYLPQWLIVVIISLISIIIIAAIFIILLRYIVKKATHNLVIEKERAEESDRLKTGFLSKVSHELRTPLNGIMGMLTLLRQTEMEESQLVYLNLAAEASHNLHSIIQELLDLNESSKPEMQVDMAETDIGEALLAVINLMRLYAEKKQIKIDFEAPKRLFWKTDRKRLQQIMIQLLLNAVDFSTEGEVRIEVILNSNLVIKIKDSGIGIDESQYDEIFIPFHQLENPFTRQQGGLGIGLSIVKELCEKIDAEVIVNSEPDVGTEFMIKLN